MKNSCSYLGVLITLFCCAFIPQALAVSGFAMLTGQNNHSNIKVKFTSASATAVSDSCITSATGAYSLNLAGGLYKVSYSAVGFQTLLLNNGFSAVYTNTEVINTVSLQPGNAVFVNGNVSGVWTATNTYYVMGDLSVPLNSTLTIQPGTVIKFMSFYKLATWGVLMAAGTPSNMITFKANDSLVPWNAIILRDNNSFIKYCIVEENDKGVIAEYVSPLISNNIVRNVQWGIYSLGGTARIKNNEVYNYGSMGIYILGACNGSITCNYIHNNSGGSGIALSSESDLLIADNHIENTEKAIVLATPRKHTIKNNYINGCGYGVYIEPNAPGHEPTIINNSIVNTSTCAIYCNNITENVKIVNNIISGAWHGVRGFNNLTFDHNIVYNCSTNFYNVTLTGLGTLIGTNSNGDSTDSYFNLYVDPKFATNNAPYLQATSPAINAGNILYNSLIGFDALKACLPEVSTGISQNENAKSEILIYPNPAGDRVFLNLDTEGRLNIYDAVGRLVFSSPVVLGINEIDIQNFKQGIYYVRVTNNERVNKGKIVKM